MQKIFRATKTLLKQPGEGRRLFRYWFLVLSFLLIVPNIALLIEITFNQPLLSPLDKLRIIFDIYASVVRFLLEPITLSLVVLSIILAFNFLIIRYIRRASAAAKGRLAGTVTMLISSHCLACGGSLLSPLIALIGGTGSYIGSGYTKTQIITVGLNVLAASIAIRSIHKASPTIIRLTSITKPIPAQGI